MNVTAARQLARGTAVLVSGKTPADFQYLTRSKRQGLLAVVTTTESTWPTQETWYVPVASVSLAPTD